MILIARRNKKGIDILIGLTAENYAPAAYELGNCYNVGLLVERDECAGERHWSHAADGGHVLATIKLLKFESLHSVFYKRPFIFLKMCRVLLSAIPLFFGGFNDPRTLGTLK
jgi:hypothetical protein